MRENLARYFVYFYFTNDIVLNHAKAGLNCNMLPSNTQINSLSEILWTQIIFFASFTNRADVLNISTFGIPLVYMRTNLYSVQCKDGGS